MGIGDVSVSGTSNNINDETYDRKVNSLDKTYEKNNVCNGTYNDGGWNSYRNLQSKTNVSQGNQNSINDKIIKLLKTSPSRELAFISRTTNLPALIPFQGVNASILLEQLSLYLRLGFHSK